MSSYLLSFAHDKKDLEICITEDNVLNITGIVGSGKSTLANQYKNNYKYIVITIDNFFFADINELDNETKKIRIMLEKKYQKLRPLEFEYYYLDIVKYAKENIKDKILVLDGAQIYYCVDYSKIVGNIIIKRTSIMKSFIRALNRDLKDIKEKNKSKKEKYKIIKRRLNQISDYKNLNKFILCLKKEV